MSTAPVQAAQQSLGYSIQEGRMLLRLLSGELGDHVAYEVWEDITVIKGNGKRIAEQITSSQSSNPLTNNATKPWHTFANWVKGVQADFYDPTQTEFILYVLQDYPLGDKLQLLHDADTLEKAESAFNAVREFFWGSEPTYSKRDNVPKTKKDDLEVIFTADKNVILHIIKNFRVVKGSFDPEMELKQAIANTHFSPHVHDDVLTRCVGWLKRKKDNYLSNNKRFILNREETIIFLNSLQKQYDSTISLDYVIDEPSDGEATQQVDRSPIYIKQLEIIDLEHPDKIRAAKDFLKSSAFRAKMAKSGEYNERHFSDLNDSLMRAWDAAKLTTEDPNITDALYGRRLYGHCIGNQGISILGMSIPPYFISGSFHHLANAPLSNLVIGWHRNFKRILNDLINGSGSK